MRKKGEVKQPPRLILTLLFSLTVFVILAITMSVVGVAVYFLHRTGFFSPPRIGTFLGIVAISSIVVGTVISLFASRIPLKPISQIIYAMNLLAAGHYETRLSLGIHDMGIAADLEESFNIMAEELQNTEMLRSDFVNDFSHEFKTPLVSIRGFARLLQKGTLSEEKEREYLGIIVSESTRLADMASEVLDLTRLENQGILTDLTEYNLSEQLRECILLLERKWTKKELEISADFGEYRIRGNQEMLRRVWINLLDNAVKFSTPGGMIEISVREEREGLYVSVSNDGQPIPEEERERIFRKFYQADRSRASRGNGIGLAIVRRIVELHGGQVWADSVSGRTVFTVRLPWERP